MRYEPMTRVLMVLSRITIYATALVVFDIFDLLW